MTSSFGVHSLTYNNIDLVIPALRYTGGMSLAAIDLWLEDTELNQNEDVITLRELTLGDLAERTYKAMEREEAE